MRPFIIVFNEKEGTSPLVRLLDRLEGVSVVHQSGDRGWEPFDRHNCGLMPLRDLEKCLSAIFAPHSIPLAEINAIYQRTARAPLEFDPAASAVGFKMRFEPPRPHPAGFGWLARVRGIRNALAAREQVRFHETMTRLFVEHGVVVFVAVRRDALRWALSKYHGDGSGKPGHMQFKMAAGELTRQQIPPFHVDLDELGDIIFQCRALYEAKRDLIDRCTRASIRVHPIFYEDFLADGAAYLKRFFDLLETPVTAASIEAALARGAHFEKVHSDDISEFVANHDAVVERFASAQSAW